MTDRIVQDGVVRAVNDQPRQVAALEALGLSGDLAASEAASWRRFVPGRMPWTEVAAYEKEIGRLEERRREVEERRLELGDRIRSAPAADLAVLADWERGGRRGSRPEPTTPALETELGRLQEEERALLHAVDAVTADRASFVEKNRDRLVREAGKARETAHERAVRALEELKDARAALIEARTIELWSALYPKGEVTRSPNFAALGGGLRRIGELAGLQQTMAAESILAALHEDVAWCASAATREQRAALEGSKQLTPDEFDQERNRALEGALQLHVQARSDQRRGQLNRMRSRL